MGLFYTCSSIISLVLFIVFFALVYINATEEFQKHRYIGSNVLKRLDDDSNEYTVGVINDDELPVHVDWREKGAVTQVKYQGGCWSCWAFATIAAVEGIHKIQTGQLISLSTQELIDCIKTPETNGCKGGWDEDALEFIVNNGVLYKGTHYSYKVRYGECYKHNKQYSKAAVVRIDGYQRVLSDNEKALQKAVAHQPVIVSFAVDDGGDFKNYKSGVFTGRCGTKHNHNMVIVGYGTDIENGMDYWIVKNSWGTGWGENGYVRIQRNVAHVYGKCFIAVDPLYPTMRSTAPLLPFYLHADFISKIVIAFIFRALCKIITVNLNS